MASQPSRTTPKQPKPEPSGASSGSTKRAQPTTKAERRALQEKQREEKAAAKASGANTKVNGAKATPSKAGPSASSTSHQQHHKATKTAEGPKLSASQEMPPASNVAVDALEQRTRGLRIFSHFGLPKHTASSNLKGPLHPAIFRLGLQFSEFRIVGANARCIATLKAFKTVWFSFYLLHEGPNSFM